MWSSWYEMRGQSQLDQGNNMWSSWYEKRGERRATPTSSLSSICSTASPGSGATEWSPCCGALRIVPGPWNRVGLSSRHSTRILGRRTEAIAPFPIPHLFLG